jgi:undecaprenyl-diphosphatase
MNWIEVILLSLVEGLTEFLPISSTGHLILTSAIFGIQEDQFVKSFNIIIQFGAILSVLVLYWKKFLPIRFDFYSRLFLSFLPAAVLGLLVKSKIDQVLGSVLIVGITLFIGGFILIWSDRFFAKNETSQKKIEDLTYTQCLILGLIQCFAFLPGVSRAAATILAGLMMGLNRKTAAEFSFFLAVPTLSGAALIKGISAIETFGLDQLHFLLGGIFLSFVFALMAIRFMMKWISQFGFQHFGYYRILVGTIIFIFYFQGKI